VAEQTLVDVEAELVRRQMGAAPMPPPAPAPRAFEAVERELARRGMLQVRPDATQTPQGWAPDVDVPQDATTTPQYGRPQSDVMPPTPTTAPPQGRVIPARTLGGRMRQVLTPSWEHTTDNLRRTGQYGLQMSKDLATMVPGTVAAAFPPEAAVIALAARHPTLQAALKKGGYEAFKALVTGGSDYLTTLWKNAMDPSHQSDPVVGGLLTGAGELGLGVVANKAYPWAKARLGKALAEDPGLGRTYRETLENLGEHTTPGLSSRSQGVQWGERGAQLTPFGGYIRERYKRGQEAIDKELKRIREYYPGGQSTQLRQTITGDLEGRFPETVLTTVPQRVHEVLTQAITTTKDALKAQYQAWDRAALQVPIAWGNAKKRLPLLGHDFWEKVTLGQAGMVQRPALVYTAADLIHTMEQLPDTITLEQARGLSRRFTEIFTEEQALREGIHRGDIPKTPLSEAYEQQVAPAIGQAWQQLNQALRPHYVDLQAVQTRAREVLQRYQLSLEMPKAMTAGDVLGRGTQLVEEPYVTAARKVLGKPRFVSMAEAHASQSDFGEVGRMPGPVLGNTGSDIGKELHELTRQSMEHTAQASGNPQLYQQWHAAQQAYAQAAEVYNSPLITKLSKASPDDLLTQMIQHERPEDFKRLRQVLGDPMWDQVGLMWLTRIMEASKTEPLGHLNAEKMLGHLNQLTRVAEKEFFPGGIGGLRTALRKADALEKALGTTDPILMRQYRTLVDDPQLWQAVQGDWIAQGFAQNAEGMIDGNKLRDHIQNALKHPSTFGELFPDKTQITELLHLAQTASVLQNRMGHLGWSGVVRGVEHGFIIGGIGWMTGNPGYALGAFVTMDRFAKLLANPKFTRLVTQGLQTPATARQAPQVIGALLGELSAAGLAGRDFVPLPEPGLQAP